MRMGLGIALVIPVIRVKFLLISSVLFLAANVFAANICPTFYLGYAEIHKQTQIHEIKKRLKNYFGSAWLKQEPLSDAEAALRLVNKLELYGSNIDLKVFDAVLKVFESSTSPYEARAPGFYVDMETGVRPKSNFFQERHWDWNIMDGYFFNAPLTLSLSKEKDLDYLYHISKTAREFPSKLKMQDLLQIANHKWALQELNYFTGLNEQYQKFHQGKSYATLYLEVKSKMSLWVNQANDIQAKQLRGQQVQSAIQAFRSSNSIFDLLILDKFFDLLASSKISDGKWDAVTSPKWLQMTDWRVYEMGLPNPSIPYLTDFIFQNSHDLVAKGYLLSILNRMAVIKANGINDQLDFYFSFLDARQSVDEQITQAPAPISYKTDFHIFSKQFSPGQVESDSLDHVVVWWNPMFSRVQSNVVDSVPVYLNKNITVASHPNLRSYIKTYFDYFRKNKTYTKKEIDHDEEQEMNASLLDTTYLVFTVADKDHLLTMIRIFDGTRSKTFIEKEFPHITLPGRDSGEMIFEIGRLFSNRNVESHSLEIIMARAAEYFKMTNAKGFVYLDANLAAKKYYERYGGSIVYTPEQLNLSPEATPLWVMKFSVEEIIKIFLKPSYNSVNVRTKN